VNEKLFIGTSGWSYPDWAGVVYPAQRRARSSDLAYIADLFDAVEINTSFYHPPSPRTVSAWITKVQRNARFLFTAKLWRRFTHEREKDWTEAEVKQVKAGMAPLQEAGKLGALLIQFPWSFPANTPNMDRLARLADTFGEFPLVVEVRHDSWEAEKPMALLRERKLNFCNIDQPRSAKGLGRTNLATGPLAYYRLHGRNYQAWFNKDAGRDQRYDYLYTMDELAPWAKDIESMLDEVEKLFVMNNNHYRGQAVVNALQLKACLTGQKVAVPEPLIGTYPVLRAVAAPRPGQRYLDF